ncbi:MAG: hypothetical protein ACYS22_17615, partial [Planctomycetota bacterium]
MTKTSVEIGSDLSARRRWWIQEEVAPRIQSAGARGALMLVRGAAQTEERLGMLLQALGQQGRPALLGTPLLTLPAFARARYAELGGPRLLSPTERRLAIAEALAALPRTCRIARLGRRPGLLDRIARLLDELGEAGLTGAEAVEWRLLMAGPRRAGRSTDRGLADLVAAYSERLRVRDATDRARATACVAAAFEQGHLDAPPLVIVDDPGPARPLRCRLVGALLSRAERGVCLLEGEVRRSAEGPTLTPVAARALGPWIEQLCGSGPRAALELFPEKVPTLTGLASFDPRVAPTADATLEVRSAPTQSEEVREAARTLRAQLDQIKGLPARARTLERCALVLPSLERYAPLVRELFPRYGIPFSMP